jgi:phage shock protein PspC (stress-responsive transcriptional regulator)
MSSPKRLYRTPSAGRLAGVCAGIADYLEADVTLIRLAWVVLSIVPGCLIGGFIAYLVAWAIMPLSNAVPEAPAGQRRLTRSTSDRKIAGVCGGLADYLAIDATAVRLLWVVLTIVPGAIVFGLVAYVVAWFIMPDSVISSGIVSPSPA